MKLIIRASVLVLVLTGITATTYTNSASANTKPQVARLSALPIPMCPPDGSTDCGITQGR